MKSHRFIVVSALYVLHLTDCWLFVSITGESFVCAFDPVGSAERLSAACTGAGAQIIQPLLDQYSTQLRGDVPPSKHTQKAEEETDDAVETAIDEDEVRMVCEFVQRCFRAAAERDIAVGSSVQMCVITAAGTRTHVYDDDASIASAIARPAKSISLKQRASVRQASPPDT